MQRDRKREYKDAKVKLDIAMKEEQKKKKIYDKIVTSVMKEVTEDDR